MDSIETDAFARQFSETWEGGYFEGNPLDSMAESSYGVYGYNSVLYTIFLACIRPYLSRGDTALEIGPGRGAWTKAMLTRDPAMIYAVDAAPAEHTRFWDYVGRDSRVSYMVAGGFDLAGVPDSSIDYFFSFGVFCHLKPAMCEAYIRALASKMKPGANGFLMIADFDKFRRCLAAAERTSLLRFFRAQSRKVWQPTRIAYELTWRLYRRRIDLGRPEHQQDVAGRASWYDWAPLQRVTR
jgi:hypothetical protein